MPIDFSRKLLELWGGTLEEISPGEPGETEAPTPDALHAEATTAVNADDTLPNMLMVPVSDGAAWSTEKEYRYIETSPVVKARAVGKESE
jgi:hypothetical protein